VGFTVFQMGFTVQFIELGRRLAGPGGSEFSVRLGTRLVALAA
jgi:hypothetical protein